MTSLSVVKVAQESTENIQKKPCICCGQYKILSEFYKHAQMSDGYLNKCKECVKAEVRSRYRKNPEKAKEQARNHYLANVEAYKKRSAEQKMRMREDARYRLTHLLGSAKARKKSEECNLTLDYLHTLYEAQQGLCALSGIKMTLGEAVNGRWHKWAMSLDRVDQSKGYIIGNVRLVTIYANVARSSFTDNDLAEFCLKVVENKQNNSSNWGKVLNVIEQVKERKDTSKMMRAQQARRDNELIENSGKSVQIHKEELSQILELI